MPLSQRERTRRMVFASTEKREILIRTDIVRAHLCLCCAGRTGGESFRSVCNIVAAAGARNGIALIAEQFIGMFNGDNRNFKLCRQKTFATAAYIAGEARLRQYPLGANGRAARMRVFLKPCRFCISFQTDLIKYSLTDDSDSISLSV